MPDQRLDDAGNEILAVWRRWVAFCHADEGLPPPDDGTLPWGDRRTSRNCIVDAELLECLLYPQDAIEWLSLGGLYNADPAVVRALNPPDATSTDRLDPKLLRHIAARLMDFFETYGKDGPTFLPGSYASVPDGDPPTDFPPITDAYTFSASVCVRTKLLLERWSARGERLSDELEVDVKRLQELADKRLTAALAGLCRSFVVSGTGIEGWQTEQVVEWPADNPSMRAIRTQLSPYFHGPDPAGAPFECGWSWGEVKPEHDHEYLEKGADLAPPDWYAQPAPYLYFTVMAVDGIADLFSNRIQASRVLSEDQSYLASWLRFFWEKTWEFWSTLAFSPGRRTDWAIEDVPWRTADGDESEYWTAYLLRIITAYPGHRQLSVYEDERRVDRLTAVLEELGQRSRVTRRSVRLCIDGQVMDDPSLRLHEPRQVRVRLVPAREKGAPTGPEGAWHLYDLAPQLLKIAGRLLQGSGSPAARERLTDLIDSVWGHLRGRCLQPDQVGQFHSYGWDAGPGGPAPETDERDVSSWYLTERVVEALTAVETASGVRSMPARTTRAAVDEVVAELRWHVKTKLGSSTDRRKILTDIAEAEMLAETSPALGLGLVMEMARDLGRQA